MRAGYDVKRDHLTLTQQTSVRAGYDVKERGKVTVRLRRIGESLRRNKKLEHPQITFIPKARIPIIKVSIGPSAGDR